MTSSVKLEFSLTVNDSTNFYEELDVPRNRACEPEILDLIQEKVIARFKEWEREQIKQVME